MDRQETQCHYFRWIKILCEGDKEGVRGRDRVDIGGRTEHVRDAAINNREKNNNKVERLNGTVRDRNRVQRDLKDTSSSDIFVEGNKIYYNFLRPHMSLDGKTPAEVCGIDLNLSREGWRQLIKLANNGRGLYN